MLRVWRKRDASSIQGSLTDKGQNRLATPESTTCQCIYAAFPPEVFRENHSCASTIAMGHQPTALDCLSASGVPQLPLVFDGERVCSTTRDLVF